MTIADALFPGFESPRRQSNLVASTFNLSATIMGGGVLSLPLAFQKCGIILGSLLMLVAAVVTERSLYLLCLCARITGATSYGEVGKFAFGTSMEYFISLVLFVFLTVVLVGYMVLVKDIWTSIVQIVTGVQDIDSGQVLLVLLIFMSPFLVQKTLHALRFNCYIGLLSVSILCLALCRHAFISPLPVPLVLWSNSLDDILFAFPIITLSFLSIFNVLPIQGSLIQPSRGRMLIVIDGAIGSSFVITLLFGMCGYLYAGVDTDGNILNNISASGDWLFFLGRLGCGLTMMLVMPMVLLPCRESLLEVLDVAVLGPHVMPVGEEIPLVSTNSNATTTRRHLNDIPWIHYLATFGIVFSCFVIAKHVPGVAFVWSLCGSFMAFLITFFLPAACYLKIQRRKYPNTRNESESWIWFSWVLLVASTIGAVACTIHTTIRLLHT
jgi:amino acid permease